MLHRGRTQRRLAHSRRTGSSLLHGTEGRLDTLQRCLTFYIHLLCHIHSILHALRHYDGHIEVSYRILLNNHAPKEYFGFV